MGHFKVHCAQHGVELCKNHEKSMKEKWLKRLIVKVGNWFLVHLFVQPTTTDAKLFSIQNLGWFSIKVQSSLSTTPIQLQNHNIHWRKEAKIFALLNSIEYVLEKNPFYISPAEEICIWLPAIFWEPSIWGVLAEHHHREHNALRCLFISLPTR